MTKDISIAAIIPCYNEAVTIAKVINGFKEHVPEAKIYVFDNNSDDKTAEIASSISGVTVIPEKRQGKGYVVQSMFHKIDADIYVMVDGDDTYGLSELKRMIAMVQGHEADMVVGNRLKTYTDKSFRPLHTFGNNLVRSLINRLFRSNLTDIMSGMRVMSREFVKKINIMAGGFEVETEMSIKALKYDFLIEEVDVHYKERPAGSFSKLNTLSDGFLVLKTIFIIFKDYRPFLFFALLSLFFFLASIAAGSIVINEYIQTRFIGRVPLAIFASGSMILSLISLVTGVILDSINNRIDEVLSFLRKNTRH